MTLLLIITLVFSQLSATKPNSIRLDLMANLRQLSNDSHIISERLRKIEMLLKANNQLYTTEHDTEQANSYDCACFGCNRTSGKDYDIWSKAFIRLSHFASKNNSLAALSTMHIMVDSMKDISKNNAEWSEYLEEAIPEFYFDNPRLAIDYLNRGNYDVEASELLILLDWGKEEEFIKKLKLIENTDPKRRSLAIKLRRYLTQHLQSQQH